MPSSRFSEDSSHQLTPGIGFLSALAPSEHQFHFRPSLRVVIPGTTPPFPTTSPTAIPQNQTRPLTPRFEFAGLSALDALMYPAVTPGTQDSEASRPFITLTREDTPSPPSDEEELEPQSPDSKGKGRASTPDTPDSPRYDPKTPEPENDGFLKPPAVIENPTNASTSRRYSPAYETDVPEPPQYLEFVHATESPESFRALVNEVEQ